MKKQFFLPFILINFLSFTGIFAQQQELYTFCTGSSYAYLIDTAGSTSNYYQRWNIGTTGYVAHMQNDTIYQGSGMGSGTGGYGSVKKWALNGATATNVWTYTASNMHHDLCPMPNGNVLVFVRETKTATQVTQAGGSQSITIYSDIIREIKPTGATTGIIVWEWKLWDHLCQNYNSSKDNYVTSISTNPQLWNINCNLNSDGFHPNGLDYNPVLDQIVFSSHNNDEIFVIDHSTTTAEAASHSGGNAGKGGDFLYRWGKPQNYGCTTNGNGITLNVIHDVRWVPSTNLVYPGYISFFHNNYNVGNARTVLFLPPYNGYNYTYTPGSVIGPATCTQPTVASFTVQNMGGTQVLENGNILIVNPNNKFYECSGTGTTYQNVSVGTVQADRLKKCEVRGPYATAGFSPAIICTNDNVTLSSSATSPMEASPTYTYLWSTGANTQNASVTPTASGTYTYTVTITNTSVGCSDEASVTVMVDECTGIEETATDPITLNIFPNPTTGIVNLSEYFTDDSFEIFVYNTYGRIIVQGKNQKTVDLSEFENGTYYIMFKSNNSYLVSKKIILIK